MILSHFIVNIIKIKKLENYVSMWCELLKKWRQKKKKMDYLKKKRKKKLPLDQKREKLIILFLNLKFGLLWGF